MSFTGSDVAPALREIADLALSEGNTDLAWAFVFLRERDDLPFGARFDDEELARLAAGANIREGLRELGRLGLLELRVEREGRPSMTWHVFVPENRTRRGIAAIPLPEPTA